MTISSFKHLFHVENRFAKCLVLRTCNVLLIILI